MNRQIYKLSTQLDIFKDKCSRLENQLTQEESKWKGKSEVEEIQLYQDTLKVRNWKRSNSCFNLQCLLQMKDKQIEALKAIVVNYNKHISNLNSQLASQEMRRSTDAI